jgi:hypothetical protein
MCNENEVRVNEAKAKYGDNHWWESDDLLTVAYYQMNEPILLIDFSKFHESVEFAIGSPVWTHQFGTMYDALKAMVDQAWEKRNSGGISRTDKQDNEMEVLHELVNFASKENVTIFVAPCSGDKSNEDCTE